MYLISYIYSSISSSTDQKRGSFWSWDQRCDHQHFELGIFWAELRLGRIVSKTHYPAFFRCQHMTVFLSVKLKTIIQQWCPYSQFWEQPWRLKKVYWVPAGHLPASQLLCSDISNNPSHHKSTKVDTRKSIPLILVLHSLCLARAPSFIPSRGCIATEYMGLSFHWYMTTKVLFDSYLENLIAVDLWKKAPIFYHCGFCEYFNLPPTW